MEMLISPVGNARLIYSEEIELASLGAVSIQRGSHVEPIAGGRWEVDLSPVNGPKLGPFITRTQAIHEEVTWLTRNWLCATNSVTAAVHQASDVTETLPASNTGEFTRERTINLPPRTKGQNDMHTLKPLLMCGRSTTALAIIGLRATTRAVYTIAISMPFIIAAWRRSRKLF